MRTLVAALLACANADETSLMQDRVKHSVSTKLTYGSESRHDSTSRLLETAVRMVKNGVTPDVVTFVDATTAEIDETIFVSIQHEHDQDQQYIDNLCIRFTDAVDRLAADTEGMFTYSAAREVASQEHHTCRSQEAYACARSRRCEEQLRQLWLHVKEAEDAMREKHRHIEEEWCVHPPSNPSIEECANQPDYPNQLPSDPHALSHCFNWGDMSPYATLDLPQDVIEFRRLSVTHFHQYIELKAAVEEAWHVYNIKLQECSGFEAALDAKIPQCDELQLAMHSNGCEHAERSKEARERFGNEWALIIASYAQARQEKDILQMDRIAEWETLSIVQCLLNHVHNAVTTSLDTGSPCPTIDSDPDGVSQTIEDCHVVTRGCRFAWNQTFDRNNSFQAAGAGFDRGDGTTGSGAVYNDDMLTHVDENGDTGTWPINPDSLTAHLCLNWCSIPTTPELPPVLPPACTPAYVAKEQGSFLSEIQSTYTTALTGDTEYPGDPLTNYLTGLSEAGWAGCAAPLVCQDCHEAAAAPPVYSEDAARACRVHEEYLVWGQSDASTFRCEDGTCLPMSGRCNGYAQCGDESDERGCDTQYGTPAYLGVSQTCPVDWNSDVYFQCANSRCIEKVGLCNGIDNCGDGTDEAQCSGTISVEVESTSGRTITVESLQSQTKTFHDREYAFESLGSFAGKTFIKYSNDDKLTDHGHVMTKIRTLSPMTVYIVKLATRNLPWLVGQGYIQEAQSGLTFRGQRMINRGHAATEWESTRAKEWDPSLITEDLFEFSQVYSKTFPAGTISIPGNNGGDGSFLIFIDRPSTSVETYTVDGCVGSDAAAGEHPLTMHSDAGHTADVRCCSMDGSTCQSQHLEGGEDYYHNGNLHSQDCVDGVSHAQAMAVCAAGGMRLCNSNEVQGCCGTGCYHDHHSIWVSHSNED